MDDGFFKKKIKNKRLNLHPFDFIGVEELRLLLVPISHLLLVFPCSCSPSRVFGLSVVAGPTSPAFCLLSHSHSSLSSLLLNLLSSPKKHTNYYCDLLLPTPTSNPLFLLHPHFFPSSLVFIFLSFFPPFQLPFSPNLPASCLPFNPFSSLGQSMNIVSFFPFPRFFISYSTWVTDSLS